MEKIDVFDFDGTIYDGDSTVDFLKFAIMRHPSVLPCFISPLLFALRMAVTRKFSLTAFKDRLFSGLAGRIDLAGEAEAFWKSEKTRDRLGEWFSRRERTLPVVIASASPDFELRPAASLLGADLLIATPCDPKTGHLTGPNCKSAEKIRRIGETLGEVQVRSMYTDDVKADGPLLVIAEEQYLVTHGVVTRLNGKGEGE